MVDSGLCKNQPGSTSTLLKNQNTTDFASNPSTVSTLPYWPHYSCSLMTLNYLRVYSGHLNAFLELFLGQKLIFYQE